MPLKRIVKYLIVIGLLACPINGLIEYLYTLGIDLRSSFDGRLFWIEKGIKDVLQLCVLVLTVASIARKNQRGLDGLFLALSLIMLLAFALTLARDPLFAMIGARSLLPILMFATGAACLSEEDLGAISRILTVLVVFIVPLALAQFILGATIYDVDGRAFGRFASRIFATFCMPGSFGLFLVSFIMFIVSHRMLSSYFLIPVAVALIFLTGSGMALLSLGLFCIVTAVRRIESRRTRTMVLAGTPAALPFAALAAYYLMPVITGRPDIWRSPLTRLHMMLNHFRDSGPWEIIVGKGLGYTTNTAFNLLPEGSALLNNAYFPESMYLSLFSQIGLIGGLLFIAMNIKIYWGSSCRHKVMIPAFMFMGLTINLLELFPVNWLYMLILGVCSRNTTEGSPEDRMRLPG